MYGMGEFDRGGSGVGGSGRVGVMGVVGSL